VAIAAGLRVLYVSKALTVAAYRDKLRALGESVEVAAVMPAQWGREAAEPGRVGVAPVRTWPARLHGYNHFHTYRGSRSMVRAGRADLVHIDEEPFSAVTFQLARACRRAATPFVFFAWQNLEKRLPPPFGAFRSYVFRHAAGAIAGTERAAAVLRAGGWTGPVAVIPQMGVDPVRFRPDASARQGLQRRFGAEPGELFIGYGGRLVREKGVDVLIRAVADLPAARLFILGDGPERAALVRLVEALGLDERVAFAGRVPSLDMPRWLAGLDVLVLPTVGRKGWVEQFGRILVEAMACGAAVIGTRTGEIPHVLGDAGVLVPPGEAGALADALRMLADAPGLRARLGEQGRARVLERFTNDRVARDTATFYRSVLRRSA
jgi:glycosyltransferase involved in cell wall biosynthesis